MDDGCRSLRDHGEIREVIGSIPILLAQEPKIQKMAANGSL